MIILGIDPGYSILGWSVIDRDRKIHGFGTIQTSSDIPFDERLLQVHRELARLLNQYNPEIVAIEKLFFNKNSKTVIDVAKAIGVIVLTVKMSGTAMVEYTPTQIKHSITGYGRATKQQIQFMIKKIFNIRQIPKPDDAADALAVALCHSLKI